MQTTNNVCGFPKLQASIEFWHLDEKFSHCVNFASQPADYSDAKKTFDIGFWQAYLPSVAITTSCVCHRCQAQGLGLAGWGVRRSNRSDLNVGDGDNGLENDIQRTLPGLPAEALTGEFSPALMVQK